MDNRFSVSDLTSYDWFKVSEKMTLQEYLVRLKRQDTPSPKVVKGIKIHHWLELLAKGDTDAQHGLNSEMDSDIMVKLPQPDLVEIPVRKMYRVNGRNILLTGRVDALVGLTVVDYKTTWRMNLESYADSIQWRAYMDMLPDYERFKYEVFKLRASHSEPDRPVLAEHRALECSRYPMLHADVARRVAEFDDWLITLDRGGHIELTPYGVKR